MPSKMEAGRVARKQMEVQEPPAREPVDVEARIFRGQVVSAEAIDRDGDILRAAGMDAEYYVQNPVVPFSHDRWVLPVARTVRLYAGEAAGVPAVLADYQYPEAGVYDLADRVHGMDAGGFLRAASVGFMPREMHPIDETGERLDPDDPATQFSMRGYEIAAWELREWSKVVVPACQMAVRSALEGWQITKAPAPGARLIEWVKDSGPCEVILPVVRGRAMVAVAEVAQDRERCEPRQLALKLGDEGSADAAPEAAELPAPVEDAPAAEPAAVSAAADEPVVAAAESNDGAAESGLDGEEPAAESSDDELEALLGEVAEAAPQILELAARALGLTTEGTTHGS